MSSRPSFLGIDLGTTNSAAAVFDGEQIHLVRNAAGATLTPSVVRYDARGQVTVGARARRLLDSDPKNTRAEFKRLMGTTQQFDFPASKLSKRPEDLAAEVLRSIRADVKEQLGFEPERAVISVPALFELPQAAATSEAARLAGFAQVEMIQEPVASALATGWTRDDGGGSWLVYDFGGGTFDASLLETRDGLLRVVGHDGDNFLGGRDFDLALVDWILGEVGRAHGKELSRADPRTAVAVRRLKLAAEEAKIDLTRSRDTAITMPGAFEIDGEAYDVDVIVDRDTLDRLALPLIDRSITVCHRLLATHGIVPGQLSRVVLVGGPTVMPLLRRRVGDALGAAFSDGLDPMTLVAQGAALYAATANLDARPRGAPGTAGRRFWLQYPSMSSDLCPYVAARLLPAGTGAAPTKLALVREDGLFRTADVELDAEGGAVIAVDLVARRSNTFALEATTSDGKKVQVDPASFTIVHGMTITDPPLSRTVGIALASDHVHVYLERGAPLPAKRTFVHHTVESLPKGRVESMLRIPIVQGEYEEAHLNRLVGTLDIGGQALVDSVPANSVIEVTIEVDRGGRLSARALVPRLGQVFESVAQLVVPDATPEQLDKLIGELRSRLSKCRADAHSAGLAEVTNHLFDVDWALSDVERDVSAARGGDADAGQKARRTVLELDAKLDEAEAKLRWPELDAQAKMAIAFAARWTGKHGTDTEKKLLGEAQASLDRARTSKQPTELQRQIRLVRELGWAGMTRDHGAWVGMFEQAASNYAGATDLRRADELVRQGRQIAAEPGGDRDGQRDRLRRVTEELWRLLPSDAESRRLGFDSGVR